MVVLGMVALGMVVLGLIVLGLVQVPVWIPSARYKIAQRLSDTNVLLSRGYSITFLDLPVSCTVYNTLLAVPSGYPFGIVQRVPTQSTGISQLVLVYKEHFLTLFFEAASFSCCIFEIKIDKQLKVFNPDEIIEYSL
jgi:hypothetical protein